MLNSKHILFILPVILLLTSCYNYRSTGLLQENNKTLPEYEKSAFEDYRIKTNDELIFRLISADVSMASLIANNPGSYGSQSVISYRVFPDGTVDLPFIKSIYVVGLTLNEASEVVEKRMHEIIPDAAIKLGLANKTFTVIGEAGSGVFFMMKDKITIFQALAMSGEINQEADFSHVRIIRENDKGLEILEFDIRPASIIDSKYYYIYPNDIIYLQRSRDSFYKVSNFSSFVGLISSSVSLLLTALYLLK